MGKIQDTLPESGPTPESLGFEQIGTIIRRDLLRPCPACGSAGEGEVDGRVVECSECEGGWVLPEDFAKIARRHYPYMEG